MSGLLVILDFDTALNQNARILYLKVPGFSFFPTIPGLNLPFT
jgi:hypothetical protein